MIDHQLFCTAQSVFVFGSLAVDVFLSAVRGGGVERGLKA